MMKSSLSDKSDSNEKNKEKARQAALRKLSLRDRTEKEIEDVLCEHGCTRQEAAEILEEFRQWGYLNDEKYCLTYYKYSKGKGKALPRITGELVQKGIPAEKVRRAFEDAGCSEDDDRSTALSVGTKMAKSQAELGKPLDEKFLSRVGRRLSYLGYDSGTCYFVMGKIRNYAKEIEREYE